MNTTWQWLNCLLKRATDLILLLLILSANSRADGIPLPVQGIAQNKGLTAGIGLGTINSADCKTLWTWTGHGNYSYNSYLSGGASIKFLGGDLDSAHNIVNQRYSIDAKIAHSQPKYVLFIGPVFSFENTNLSVLRKEFSNTRDHNEDVKTQCSELYAEIGSSVGYQSGIGFLATPSWGFNFGHNLDLTLNKVFIASFSGAIAFNLREQFEKLMENTRNFWLSLEYSASFSKKNIGIHNVILGAALGF
jgi:hypothetical protein